MALNTFRKMPEQEITGYVETAEKDIAGKHYNLAFGSLCLAVITAKRCRLAVPADVKTLLDEIGRKEPKLKEKAEKLIKSVRI